MSLAVAIHALEHLTDAGTNAIASLPATPDPRSPRGRDRTSLRNGPHGPARATLLDRLHHDLTIRCQHHTLLTAGMSDVLIAAHHRDNNGINMPLLALATRALAEAAGETHWLAGHNLGGHDRPAELARRWLTWAWQNLDGGRDELDDDSPADTLDAIAQADRDLDNATRAAGWEVSRVSKSGRPAHPMILTRAGTRGAVPTYKELVDELHQQPGAYADLSRAAHNKHNGIAGSVTVLGPVEDGRVAVGVSGAFMPLPSALLTAGLAAVRTTRALAHWNGIATPELDTAISHLRLVSINARHVGDSTT